MASKRMFDRAIIDTDRFMDLSMSMKGTYFVFGMEADDEGFVSCKKVMRIHGVNEDDIKVLIAKGFLISFKSGVIVITDWNSNNYLDKNRIKATEYQEEKKQLTLTKDNKYVFNKRSTSIEENSIVESRIEERVIDAPVSKVESKRFVKPTEDEVKAYCKERNNNIVAVAFLSFYDSNGWKVGKNPMKDWKAAIRTWEQRSTGYKKPENVVVNRETASIVSNIKVNRGTAQ